LDDCSLVSEKSICLLTLIADAVIQKELENLINLRHLCIAGPISFVFRAQSREVTIVRLYSESGSLGTVFARCPAW
jgi:hypothetical protein